MPTSLFLIVAFARWSRNYEVKISSSSLLVSPGDDIAVEIVATNSTSGAAYVNNETTGKSVAIAFPAWAAGA